MCKNVMHIHEPRIVTDGGLSKLVAEFELNGETRELFFEVDEEFEKYLTPERTDPFVFLVLIWALCDGFDIVYDAPITDRLYYQLTEYFIPIVSKYVPEYSFINLSGPHAPEIEPSGDAIVTGLSCGVDSFYTVLSHMKLPIKEQRLTHLIMNNVGALTKKYENSVKVFNKRKEHFAQVASELGLKFVAVNTNIVEQLESYPDFVNQPEPFRNAACAYALKRLFKCYYLSAGIPLDKFQFSWEDPSYYEPIVINTLSGQFLPFYSAGAAATRGEKVAYIADEPIVQKYLNVCGDDNDSCCFKCTRTLFELYAFGKLDKYGDVFDIDYFKKNLADRIAFTYFDPNEREHFYPQETMKIARENGVKIPAMVYVLGVFKYIPLYFLKDKLKGCATLRDFYRNHDLKTKLFGKGKKNW